jgi:hypothetical protein
MCGLHWAQGDEECVFHGLDSKPMSAGFLVEPQNQGCGFPGLGLKTGSCGSVIWPQNDRDGFLVLTFRMQLCKCMKLSM